MLFRFVALLLIVLAVNGCTAVSSGDSSSKEVPPWERVPWEGMSPEERDRTAVADLMKSEKFSGPRCRWLKYGAWILAWPSETHLYRAAQEVGIIEMEEVGTDNRTGTPEPAWRITITEAGKNEIADCPKVSPGRNDWGVPVSRRRLISAKYVGEGTRYSGITLYDVEYEWVPTAVGEKVKAHLTGPMKVEEGKYRAQISLKKVPHGWYVDQTNDFAAVRID